MLSQPLRETIRVQGGLIPLLELHLARLSAGGCDATMVASARREAMRAAEAWPEPYGRMTLHVATDGQARAEVSSAASMIDVPGGPSIAFVVTPEPVLPPGGAKPEDRSFWDRAVDKARAEGADVAVLVSAEGLVFDTSHATLWARFGDRLLTPKSPPALAGVSRRVVFEASSELGFSAEEAPLTAADVDSADEVVLTTAVAGAIAVRGRGGPAAEALATWFARLFAGPGGGARDG